MYAVIEAGGEEIERRGGVPDLEEMQDWVGGYVEVVDLSYDEESRRRLTAWVNETGKLEGLMPTAVVPMGGTHEVLCGPVLFTATEMDTGETVSLTEAELYSLEFADEYKTVHRLPPLPVLRVSNEEEEE